MAWEGLCTTQSSNKESIPTMQGLPLVTETTVQNEEHLEQVQDKGALGAKLVQRYSASLVTSRVTYCPYCPLVTLGLVYYELAMNESLGSLGVSSPTWMCLHTQTWTHTHSERDLSSCYMLYTLKFIYASS